MRNFIKVLIGFFAILLFRLSPFRIPNVEPIMALQMPFAKKFGKLSAFLFGFLSIAIYDLFVPVGLEMLLITAITYGCIGIVAGVFFKNFHLTNKTRNYIVFTVFATIFYDLVTGVLVAPLFGQSIVVAFMLQIPFTVNHLIGNILVAFMSPYVYKWVASNKKFELNFSFSR